MQSVETIIEAHAREMKRLRKSLEFSSKHLSDDRSRLDRELDALKRRAAMPLVPPKKPTPLAVRLFSMLF